jgi:uncharacterized protein
MRVVDVNVLVYAHRPDTPRHDDFRRWLEAARQADEPLGLSTLVLSGFVRMVTHARVFRDPTPTSLALEFCEELRASPNAVELVPGHRHWPIFEGLCRAIDARGNDVPDAFLAALTIEAGSTWWSADRGFARFRDLRWRHPLDE